MKVRPARVADIPAILLVEQQAANAAHWSMEQYERVFAQVEFIDDGAAGGMPAPSSVLRAGSQPGESIDSPRLGCGRYEGRVVLVVEGQSAIQGFLVGRAVGPEWELENMGVAAAALRRGVGSLLLRRFLDVAGAEGAEAVFLEVRESNLAARRLYEKFKFVESGGRKGYYRNPLEDAALYRFGILSPG